MPEGLETGTKQIIFNATDNNENTQTAKLAVNMIEKNTGSDKSTMIADCENGNFTNLNTPWYSFTDNSQEGASTITPLEGSEFVMTKGGAEETENAVMVTYELDKGDYIYDPYVGFGFNLCNTPDGSIIPMDLTGSTGISLYHKGNGVSVQISLATVIDYNNYSFGGITAHEDWEKVTINWDDFFQASWGEQIEFDPAMITQIQFQITPSSGKSGSVWIDQIRLEGIDLALSSEKEINSEKSEVIVNVNSIIINSQKLISNVKIIDVSGKELINKIISGKNAEISTSKLKSDIYIAMIIYDDLSFETIKFNK